MTNQGKNENEDEKNWKNEFNFLILDIRIRLYGNFHENRRKTFLTLFLLYFWQIEAKMTMKIKKNGKISSIFEFSISKLLYTELFIKIWERCFWNLYLRRNYTKTEVSNEFSEGAAIEMHLSMVAPARDRL